jgi:predicted nucleic-acid-binding Zn-ribbon protein
MKRTNKCSKCGSTDVIADAKAIDRSHQSNQTEFTVATYRKPEAIIFKGQQDTTVSAWVCVACGYVELYADSPKNLKLQDG